MARPVRPVGKFQVAAFTLVEALVTLAVLSILSLLVFDSLRSGGMAFELVRSKLIGSHDIAAAQRFLRASLEQLYPFDPDPNADEAISPVEGAPSQLTFSSPGPQSGMGGLYRFRLRTTESARTNLVIEWRIDRNGKADPLDTVGWRQEQLCAGIQELSISYLNDKGEWRDTWNDLKRVPSLIRVRVAFPKSDKRMWPDLYVKPRITTDANCVFDPVAQACRA